MLSKIFSTASLLVVAWLTMQMGQTQQSVESVRHAMETTVAGLATDFDQTKIEQSASAEMVLERLDEVISRQEGEVELDLARKDLDETQQKLAAKDKEMKKMRSEAEQKEYIAMLQGAYISVAEAEVKGKDKKGAEAAEMLLSIKQNVWKLSGKLPESKDQLRGLMGPIDVLAGKWKKGDFSKSADSIQAVLSGALAKRVK